MNKEAFQIERVAIIGCGTIGISWAAYFLSRGLAVSAWDPDVAVREAFAARVAEGMRTLDATPRMPDIAASQAAAVAAADLIVENAPESAELKQALLAELQLQAPPESVITSSTSSLRHSDIATQVNDPGRVVIAHPFNPPHLVPLIELYGPDPGIVERLMVFYRSIGKQPVMMRKEMVGHIANRLSSALWREALYLLQEGVATVEDIDRAVTAGPGLRWAIQGPFMTYHLGGGRGGIRHYLDHLGSSQEYRWASLGQPVMNDALKARIIAGVDEATDGRDIEALFANRDAMLVVLQHAVKRDLQSSKVDSEERA